MPKVSAAESTPTTIPYDEFARNPAGILEQLTPGGDPVIVERSGTRYQVAVARPAHQGRPALGACRLRDGCAAHRRRQEARVSGRGLYPSAVSVPAVGSQRVFLDSSGFLALIHPAMPITRKPAPAGRGSPTTIGCLSPPTSLSPKHTRSCYPASARPMRPPSCVSFPGAPRGSSGSRSLTSSAPWRSSSTTQIKASPSRMPPALR